MPPFEYEPNAAMRLAAHQAKLAEEQERRTEWNKHAERQALFEQKTEGVFDAVTQLAGGAPTHSAAETIWRMVMAEDLPCEAIAQAIVDKGQVVVEPQDRIDEALNIAMNNKEHDGSHHKDWCIDQMCRVLAGEKYRGFVAEAMAGDEGPETYGWDIGIAP
jgi:hypothetical protein